MSVNVGGGGNTKLPLPKSPNKQGQQSQGQQSSKSNVVRLPIGDNGYAPKGKRERKQHEHSIGYGTESFDIIDELSINREQYSIAPGESHSDLSMISFPEICSIGADSIRAAIISAKVGLYTTISCCIANALVIIYDHQDIKDTLESRDQFASADPNLDGDEVLIVSRWFKGFPIELPPMTGARQNIKVPLTIGSSLSELASGIGITTPTLGVICTMMTMATQECVNKDHRKSMDAFVAQFMKTINRRIRGTRALVNEYGLL